MNTKIETRLEKIEYLLSSLTEATSKPFDFDEAATYLHKSKSHLYHLTSKGLIAHYKPAGKKIYFQKKDLDGYLLRNRRAAASEIEEEAADRIVNNRGTEVGR